MISKPPQLAPSTLWLEERAMTHAQPARGHVLRVCRFADSTLFVIALRYIQKEQTFFLMRCANDFSEQAQR
jgi:hypothetical protein